MKWVKNGLPNFLYSYFHFPFDEDGARSAGDSRELWKTHRKPIYGYAQSARSGFTREQKRITLDGQQSRAFLFKYYCVGEFNRKETILYDRMKFLSRAIFT